MTMRGPRVTYINSFHVPGETTYGPAIIETDAQPVPYMGFEIFQSAPNSFDVVRNGLCVGMYAGMEGAKRSIDIGRGIHGENARPAEKED